MNWNYQQLLPSHFADHSRVWIYQSNRPFGISEAIQLEDMLNNFTASWLSHGAPVKAYGNLFFGRFIVLMADESATTVGGCSTDSSVRFIKEVETRFAVSLFDRQMLSFLVNNKIENLPLSQLQYAMDNGFLNADTIYFNNLVATKKELEDKWMIPVKESWLAKKVVIKSKL